MSDVLQNLGIKKQSKGEFDTTLFYFFKEFNINPFDQEYLVYNPKGKLVYKVVKKGISPFLFGSLIKELQAHYKKEQEAYKKASRKRR